VKSKNIKEYILQLAEEENLTKEEIETIVSSPFKVAADKMKNIKEHEFPTIYIMKIGTFYVTPWAKNFWRRKNESSEI